MNLRGKVNNNDCKIIQILSLLGKAFKTIRDKYTTNFKNDYLQTIEGKYVFNEWLVRLS